jgi:hypothetical protein
MSFSDLILTILVLAGIAFVVWVMDINPYSKQLQVYSQTCDNMILDNTYCKGKWTDNPVQTYAINLQENQIIYKSENQSESTIYETCSIQDSKNFSCTNEADEAVITVKDGMLIFEEKSAVQQITRLQWLQNKFLEIIS